MIKRSKSHFSLFFLVLTTFLALNIVPNSLALLTPATETSWLTQFTFYGAKVVYATGQVEEYTLLLDYTTACAGNYNTKVDFRVLNALNMPAYYGREYSIVNTQLVNAGKTRAGALYATYTIKWLAPGAYVVQTNYSCSHNDKVEKDSEEVIVTVAQTKPSDPSCVGKAGTTKCFGNTLKTCSQYGDTFQFDYTTNCAATGETCMLRSDGRGFWCGVAKSDECNSGSIKCVSRATYEKCGSYGSSGGLKYGGSFSVASNYGVGYACVADKIVSCDKVYGDWSSCADGLKQRSWTSRCDSADAGIEYENCASATMPVSERLEGGGGIYSCPGQVQCLQGFECVSGQCAAKASLEAPRVPSSATKVESGFNYTLFVALLTLGLFGASGVSLILRRKGKKMSKK